MWVPFAGPNAERRQSVGAPLVGALRRAKRREKTIGRGTPCGCPSQGKRREKTIGRGTPCGCPSQDKTPRTVQIIVRYRKFSTSLATGGRFLVLKRMTIGRGTPCGCPSQGQTPRTVQIIVRYRKFSTSLATGGRFLVLKRMTIGRGAPCGRPSWAIVASEFRCDCPETKLRSYGKAYIIGS